MTELQKVELDILKEFLNVCQGQNLRVYAVLGTLLGAYRNKGFIPWDDDIDIAMPRKDYNILCNSNFFKEPYFLQTPKNDSGYVAHFAKLRRSDTTFIRSKYFPNGLTNGGHMGICIDIIPLDDVPDGYTAEILHNTANNICEQMRATAGLDNCDTDVSIEKLEYCYGNGGIKGQYEFLADRYETFCGMYSNQKYYTIVSNCQTKVYDKKWFNDVVYLDFEDIKIPVPAEYEKVLLTSYSDSGLLEYDTKFQVGKHTIKAIVDTKKSYKEYKKKYTDMLKDIDGKDVFIFGAGDSLRIFKERYCSDIVCCFDNSKAKWGTTVYGIKVESPDKIKELLTDNSRLIIASVIYYKEIEIQLDSMGIKDYYVFIDGMRYEGTSKKNLQL